MIQKTLQFIVRAVGLDNKLRDLAGKLIRMKVGVAPIMMPRGGRHFPVWVEDIWHSQEAGATIFWLRCAEGAVTGQEPKMRRRFVLNWSKVQQIKGQFIYVPDPAPAPKDADIRKPRD